MRCAGDPGKQGKKDGWDRRGQKPDTAPTTAADLRNGPARTAETSAPDLVPNQATGKRPLAFQSCTTGQHKGLPNWPSNQNGKPGLNQTALDSDPDAHVKMRSPRYLKSSSTHRDMCLMQISQAVLIASIKKPSWKRLTPAHTSPDPSGSGSKREWSTTAYSCPRKQARHKGRAHSTKLQTFFEIRVSKVRIDPKHDIDLILRHFHPLDQRTDQVPFTCPVSFLQAPRGLWWQSLPNGQ